MRPMKAERKSRKSGRGSAGRTSARIARIKEAPRPSFGRRETFRNDVIARTFRRVRGWFSRPMLILSGSILAFAVVSALLVGGYVGRTLRAIDQTTDALVSDAGFGISEVHIAGNGRTPPETILAALGFQPGQSIFGADLHSARRQLMALDWVADAQVKRRYPDAIAVRIVEKIPFALWQSPDGTIYVVERSGNPITSKNLEILQPPAGPYRRGCEQGRGRRRGCRAAPRYGRAPARHRARLGQALESEARRRCRREAARDGLADGARHARAPHHRQGHPRARRERNRSAGEVELLLRAQERGDERRRTGGWNLRSVAFLAQRSRGMRWGRRTPCVREGLRSTFNLDRRASRAITIHWLSAQDAMKGSGFQRPLRTLGDLRAKKATAIGECL